MTTEQQRRQAALRVTDKFADKHGCANRNWREIDKGGDDVLFVGTDASGREFCFGYVKQTERERTVA